MTSKREEPLSAAQIAERLVPRHSIEPKTDADSQVVVRIGRDNSALYAVRSVITDCTVGTRHVLVIETDPIGVSHDALRLGWTPGPRRVIS